ncbi:MAG: hypothetical protein ABIH11_00675 [Candidatus Altiarchaeota archaeon]
MKDGREVHTLICHKHVNVGLKCLDSLLRFSQDPLKLVIHDDGTLTDKDAEEVKSKLDNAMLIRRDEADEKVKPMLANHPHCMKLREVNPLSLKLMDGPLLSNGDYAYCDADVLFTRPFTGLFKWPDEKTSMVFMKDSIDSYVLKLRHVIGSGRMRILSKINTGLIFVRRGGYSLDALENIVQKLDYRQGHQFYEQTCWALMAAGAECRQYDPLRIRTTISDVRGCLEDYRGLTGIHLTGPNKMNIDYMLDGLGSGDDEEVEEIGTVDAAEAGLKDLSRTIVYFTPAYGGYVRLYRDYYANTRVYRMMRGIREKYGI